MVMDSVKFRHGKGSVSLEKFRMEARIVLIVKRTFYFYCYFFHVNVMQNRPQISSSASILWFIVAATTESALCRTGVGTVEGQGSGRHGGGQCFACTGAHFFIFSIEDEDSAYGKVILCCSRYLSWFSAM